VAKKLTLEEAQKIAKRYEKAIWIPCKCENNMVFIFTNKISDAWGQIEGVYFEGLRPVCLFCGEDPDPLKGIKYIDGEEVNEEW